MAVVAGGVVDEDGDVADFGVGLIDGGLQGAEVADVATRDLSPVDDVHADGAYRRRVAAVLVRRAVEEARARG